MSLSLEALEDALWAAAAERLPAAALEPKPLAEAIHARTRRYTSERAELAAPLTDARARARDLAARAVFFSVADAAKVAVPIAELAGRGALPVRPPGAPLAVLDVGAGCGAMTLGLLAAPAVAASGRSLAVTAVDRDADALAVFAAAARAFPSLALTTRAADAAGASSAALPAGPFELILAGTLLNELPAAARAPLVRALVARLAPDGALLLLEPALRETSRALHALRDELIASAAAHVFAPCTRTAAPCPALADPRDWCHEDRPFRAPPRLARLISATGLRAHGLKFAYLTLRRAPLPLVAVTPPARALRVVSDAVDQKGTVERFVCGDDGRTRLRLLRRAGHDVIAPLAHSRRGDVLVAEPGDPAPALTLVRPAAAASEP